MTRSVTQIDLEKMSENLLFLAEVFGEKEESDLPKVPFLELARCFDLRNFDNRRGERRRRKRSASG